MIVQGTTLDATLTNYHTVSYRFANTYVPEKSVGVIRSW
jgi:hypothetical protein